ncbi:DUF2845 domain-containing protein [uncultured Kushneria sp.]|uniref:DUF2845 domain-containing protein n=1 Tax=uncultured Kushneria sp. TaxID=905033 RepID=UPI0026125E17|nr:DUF2845 domain-containing protein [uncultured Kushneria sp.]
MVGFSSHRDWLYYLTVDHNRRRCGHGCVLVGKRKIMLMVRCGQPVLEAYYRAPGFEENGVVMMGKRMIEDDQV